LVWINSGERRFSAKKIFEARLDSNKTLEEDVALLVIQRAPPLKILNKASDIVRVLGGPDQLAKLTFSNKDAVWQWQNNFKAFPSNTFVIMIDELKKLDCEAPPHLWKMRGFKKVSKPRPTRKSPLTQKSRKVASRRRDRARTRFAPKSRFRASLAASS